MLEQHHAKAQHLLAGPDVRRPKQSVLGPAANPVLGYFPEQLKFARDPIGYLTSLYREYGTLSAWTVNKPVMLFSFAPAMNQVLSSADRFDWAPKLVKPSQPSALDILSTSMLRMNGEEYKSRRRLVLPAFHQNLVEHWRDRMAALTRQSLDTWQPGQEINLHTEMHKLVAAISMSAVFNIEDPARIKKLDGLMYELYFVSTKLTSRLLPYDLPGTSYRRMHRTAEKVVALLKEFIKESPGDDSMLAMLVASRDEKGEGFDEAELLGEVYHLMNLDNLISVLTWTLLLLAQHPTVYADTLDELESMLHGDDPTLEQLGRLTLLDRVLKESLRLFPPFAIGRRFAIEACQFGPLELPARCKIFFSQYITHRLPEIYSEPNRFMPQRWETLKPSQYEYLPFGSGSHYCLGMRFAMLELKVVLALMIQRYRLEVIPGTRVDRAFRLVMETRRGVQVRINKQDRKFKRNPITGNIHEMVTLE